MDDWAKLLIEVGAPIVAAIIGYIVMLARLRDRQHEQQKAIEDLKEELGKRCDKIGERLDNMPKGFSLEIGTHKQDLDKLEEAIGEDKKEQAEIVGRLSRELRRELKELREKIDRVRDSSSDFAKEAELAKVVMEMNARFERISKTLGRLEGMMYRGRVDDP